MTFQISVSKQAVITTEDSVLAGQIKLVVQKALHRLIQGHANELIIFLTDDPKDPVDYHYVNCFEKQQQKRRLSGKKEYTILAVITRQQAEELHDQEPSKAYTWTAIYQIGGYVNFSWRKCLPCATYEAGANMRDELQRMGYPADLYRTDILDEVGLPTEYRSLIP